MNSSMRDQRERHDADVRNWLKLTLTVDERAGEALSDLLSVLSDAGVEIRPVDDHHCQISGYFRLSATGTGQEQEIHGFLTSVETQVRELLVLYGLPMAPLVTRVIEDQDWATSWQQHFKPFEIVPGLVIRPSWEEYTGDEDTRVIEMDPGMAFGTGQHATTRMALSLMMQTMGHDFHGRLLDVGTGTGILGMAGALFGAVRVIGLDNDPEAVAIARKNVSRNRLTSVMTVRGDDPAAITDSFDIICANIVHDVLVQMGPQLKRLLAPGGRLVLSGIRAGVQERNLLRIYKNLGVACGHRLEDGEWVALLFAEEK